MLYQILSPTPVYVWAILAFLVYRGVLASRDRDITVPRMLVIPLVMLVLALQAIAMRFGVASVAMAAWAVSTAAIGLQRWTFGPDKVTPGAQAHTLRILGSWTPLAMMMVVFLIKYGLAVALAIRPQLAADAVFAATVCGLLGLCNGYFVGQLARDLAAARRLVGGMQADAESPAPANIG